MDRKAIIGIVAAAIVFGAAGFGGGVLIGRNTGGARAAFGNNRQAWMNGRAGANGANGQGRGAAVGKVTAKDAQSFTLKTADGSTRTVYYSASTQFSKVSSATAADVSNDETVTAMGSTTSAGDVTANSVIIGGGFGGFGGFRGGMMGGNRGGTTNGGGNSGNQGGFPQDGGPGGPPPGF